MKKLIQISVEVCEYYPLLRGEGPVCGAGSAVGDLICTKAFSKRCEHATQERARNLHEPKEEVDDAGE